MAEKDTLMNIFDMLTVISLENTMLLRGMDALIVQRLGIPFVHDKENQETLRNISNILDGMNVRNGITQMTLEEKLAEFQRIMREGREKNDAKEIVTCGECVKFKKGLDGTGVCGGKIHKPDFWCADGRKADE